MGLEFQERFNTEQACIEYGRQAKWPDGFRCARWHAASADELVGFAIQTREPMAPIPARSRGHASEPSSHDASAHATYGGRLSESDTPITWNGQHSPTNISANERRN